MKWSLLLLLFIDTAGADKFIDFSFLGGGGNIKGPDVTVDNRNTLWDGEDGKLLKQTDYTMPVPDGSSGQVLTTDGMGAVTFETPLSALTGGILTFEYTKGTTGTTCPSSGEYRINTADPSLATLLLIHDEDRFAVDHTTGLNALGFEDTVAIRRDPDVPGNNEVYTITSDAGTDLGTCFSYDVVSAGNDGTISIGSDVLVDLFFTGQDPDNVKHPGTSTDFTNALFDGTTGKLLKPTDYTMPVADGVPSQVLTTDGNGAVSFQDGAGGFAIVGQIFPHAATTCPDGSLYADGSAVDRGTYGELFSVIGTTWGVGDGSTTFNLPDLQDQFIRGDGSSAIATAEADSTARPNSNFTSNTTGNHAHASSGNHGHAVTGNHNHANTGFDRLLIVSGTNTATTVDNSPLEPNILQSLPLLAAGDHTHANAGTHAHASAGNHSHSITGGGDAETRPENKRVRFCIIYTVVATQAGLGDVIGPGSSTDEAVTRWNGGTGQVIQDSLVTINDTGEMTVNSEFTFPNLDGTASQSLVTDGAGNVDWQDVGDLFGPTPATSIDDNIVSWDGTTGRLVQDSGVAITEISTNTANIGTNTTNIATNATNIGTNATNIATNTSDIADRVVGPNTSTDNAIARYDGTTGKLVQDSTVTISDGGAVTVNGNYTLPTTDGDAGELLVTDGAGNVSFGTSPGTYGYRTENHGNPTGEITLPWSAGDTIQRGYGNTAVQRTVSRIIASETLELTIDLTASKGLMTVGDSIYCRIECFDTTETTELAKMEDKLWYSNGDTGTTAYCHASVTIILQNTEFCRTIILDGNLGQGPVSSRRSHHIRKASF